MASSSNPPQSNLVSFLTAVTPKVPSASLAKSWCLDLSSFRQPFEQDKIDFFFLGKMWDEYSQWSAYGVGVDVRLANGDVVTQYYGPTLSAVQLYTNRDYSGYRNIVEPSVKDDDTGDTKNKQVDASSDASNLDPACKKQCDYLYLDYSEGMSPYLRVPLLDKVRELAKNYPGLLSFKSTDLSPKSWLSVAWYPIYHIPPKGTIRELFTCFLSYHKLSSFVQDCSWGGSTSAVNCIRATKDGKKNIISLPPFGIATYKLQGSLWMMPNSGDLGRLHFLFRAAELWLKNLNVEHHDFSFFVTHTPMPKAAH